MTGMSTAMTLLATRRAFGSLLLSDFSGACKDKEESQKLWHTSFKHMVDNDKQLSSVQSFAS